MTDENTNPEQGRVSADSPNEHLVIRYQHDCENCKPMGQFQEYDLYFCDSPDITVVARYGDIGYEYNSGLHLTGIPAIKVAVTIAKAVGYIDA